VLLIEDILLGNHLQTASLVSDRLELSLLVVDRLEVFRELLLEVVLLVQLLQVHVIGPLLTVEVRKGVRVGLLRWQILFRSKGLEALRLLARTPPIVLMHLCEVRFYRELHSVSVRLPRTIVSL